MHGQAWRRLAADSAKRVWLEFFLVASAVDLALRGVGCAVPGSADFRRGAPRRRRLGHRRRVWRCVEGGAPCETDEAVTPALSRGPPGRRHTAGEIASIARCRYAGVGPPLPAIQFPGEAAQFCRLAGEGILCCAELDISPRPEVPEVLCARERDGHVAERANWRSGPGGHCVGQVASPLARLAYRDGAHEFDVHRAESEAGVRGRLRDNEGCLAVTPAAGVAATSSCPHCRASCAQATPTPLSTF